MTQPIRFGIVGTGTIASFHARAIGEVDGAELAAVMDPVGIGEIAAEFKVSRAYEKEEALLADPRVQAVYIASPVHCHAKQIASAAAAGKHILCEKPLTLSTKEAETAVAVCREHGVFLQEGYMMKFHGAHARIKELINAGRLGTLVYMRAQLSCWYPQIGGAWRQDPETGGGGALMDMATHLYDLLEHFAGPIRRVAALTGTLVQDYRSDDASTTLMEFQGGAHATVDCFFCIPDEASRTRLEIYGSKGAILSEGTIGQSTGGVLEGILGLGEAGYDAAQDKDVARKFETIPFEAINPYTAECEYFADCVLSGRPPAVNSGESAIHILSVAEQAYASSRSQAVMTVREGAGSEEEGSGTSNG